MISDGQPVKGRLAGAGSIGSVSKTTHTIDGKLLDLGLQVLDFVREHCVLLRTLTHHIYRVIRMAIVSRKIMFTAVDSLDKIIGDAATRDAETKLRTVTHIFQNSYQPIQTTKLTTVEDVCRAVTGENIRWETIGNILIMASLCLVHIHSRDLALLDPEKRSKQDLITPFHTITDSLITLRSASPMVNELVVSLKYSQLLLAFQRFGDSSEQLPQPCLPYALSQFLRRHCLHGRLTIRSALVLNLC